MAYTATAQALTGTPAHIAVSVPASMRVRFRSLQALADAIAYRRARTSAYCPDCASAPPGSRCDDHARDLELIIEYQNDAATVIATARAVESILG